MEKLGDNIRFFREQLGWTQKQLAERVSISRSVLTRWERGSLTPDIQYLISLSDIFQISIDSLVGRKHNQEFILQEVKRVYKTENDILDTDAMEILEYVNKNSGMKKAMLDLTRMNKGNRSLVEEVFKVTVLEILKR